MATFNIHEDIENNENLAENRRQAKDFWPRKREVLGVIDNKIQNVPARTGKPSFNSIKPGDENAYVGKQKQAPPVVPVAQFKAFKVYEDKITDEVVKQISKKFTEKTKENTAQIKKEFKEPTLSQAAARLPLRDVSEEKKVTEESPMYDCSQSESSVESRKNAINSFISALPKNITVQNERDTFYDIKEYRSDIYKYLRERETRYRPKPGYMNKQPDITASMRTILVDWLVEVAEEYKLQTETLYLTVNFIDRFLSYMSVVRAKLQLVGTAAMFIASKYEEIYPPDVNEFVYITDDTYKKQEVLRMEHLILKVLSFDVSVPTAYTFIKDLCTVKEMDEKIMFLALYISELSMLEADPFLQYLPSHIAYSSIAIARYNLDEEPWPANYETESGYSLKHLTPCVVHLQKLYSSASIMQQQAIQDKYKSPKYQHVSMILPKDLTSNFVHTEETPVPVNE